MGFLLRNPVVYIISYLVLMIPTYILPYFGSNSLIINGAAAVFGRGPSPQWWMHAWCLAMLIAAAHVRGSLSGRKYLSVFPFLALAFDLTPGLNVIPLVPTVMHVFAMVLGVKSATETNANPDQLQPRLRVTGGVAALLSIIALFGIGQSLAGFEKTAKEVTRKETPKQPAQEPSRQETVVTPTRPATSANASNEPTVAIPTPPASSEAIAATTEKIAPPPLRTTPTATHFRQATAAKPSPKPRPADTALVDEYQRALDKARLEKANKTLDDLLK